MSPSHLVRSHERRNSLIQHSQEVLADIPHAYGSQAFILSYEEARLVGLAIANRDHKGIRTVIGDTLESATDDYTATTVAEYTSTWNDTLASIYGEDVSLIDFFATDDTRELLNMSLTGSEQHQLGLDTIGYLKLLETTAILSMPDAGFRNYPESRRQRSGGNLKSLFYRSISLLTAYADSEPGIRSVREGVINHDPEALIKYLEASARAQYAQSSLSTIIEMDEHEIRRAKTQITRDLNHSPSEEETNVDEYLHILDWKILTGKDDREGKHKKIKGIIAGQSKTAHQKRQLFADWCPERLDFLIEIAETGISDGRNPVMYISNRFEEGAGVYVAVELDSPSDPSKKIVFADNPLAGNALYIVDEVRLENEGRPNDWQNVLGASRRIARERGAMRKYHSKNWQAILPEVMSIGDLHTKPLHKPRPELVGKEVADENPPLNSTEELVQRQRALIALGRTLLKK